MKQNNDIEIRLATLLLFCGLFFSSTAQNSLSSLFSISADFGATTLIGDNDINSTSIDWNNNLGIAYRVSDAFEFQLDFGLGSLNGQRQIANFRISEMSFIDFRLGMFVNPFFFVEKKSRLSARIYLGAGQIHFRVKTSYFDSDEIRTSYGYPENDTKGLGIGGRKIVFHLPIGGQIAYKINNSTSVNLNVYNNLCNSDLIDGVGNGAQFDWYFISNIGVTYRLSTPTQNHKKGDISREKQSNKPSKNPRRITRFGYFLRGIPNNRWDLL